MSKDKFAVCPTCEGAGKHVNPSIDAHGIGADEFNEDPDFADAYFSGAYDVACVECKGLRVVPGCAVEDCTEPALAEQRSGWTDRRDRVGSTHWATCYEHLSDEDREDQESLADSYAIQAAEIRMGA